MKVKHRSKKVISKQSKLRKKIIKKSFKKSHHLAHRNKSKSKAARSKLQNSIFSENVLKMKSTNEENTIKLVKKLLGDETIETVPGYDEEINLLQDLDLVVLGSSPEEYKRYRELLRKEYSYLDDSSYTKMRLKQNEPQASTSGASSTRSLNKETPDKRKHFVKIKDNKYREELIQKYKLNTKKRYFTGLNGFGSPSLSQAISKKIVDQIKKRNNKTKSKSPPKFVRNIMEHEHGERDSERNNSSENLDDDCICIEAKPEVILIDDESIANINVVKELELKYLKFKQYEPIGKIRMNQSNDNKSTQMLTSTPNPRRLNCKTSSRMQFHEDTGSSFGSISSSTIVCNTDDVTIVEDANYQPTDIIVIDDTIIPRSNSLSRQNKRSRPRSDDSVIFVSENLACKPATSTPSFIPLNTPIEEVKIKLAPISPASPRPKRQRNELFTSREEKQLKVYNENAYNPNKDISKELTQKRMVIVDGSNVAYQHALNKEFSVKGLKICLDYFGKMGHEVKAVVPQYRLQKQRSSDPNELETLHREGKIVFTPCKNLPGKSSTSYDDRFILQLASELDAAVVSNDNYRDLLNENSAFKKIIENRVIGYTWCNDIFILPKDPYGKWGPTLATILNRS